MTFDTDWTEGDHEMPAQESRRVLSNENRRLRKALATERAAREAAEALVDELRRAGIALVAHEALSNSSHRWCASGCVLCDFAAAIRSLPDAPPTAAGEERA